MPPPGRTRWTPSSSWPSSATCAPHRRPLPRWPRTTPASRRGPDSAGMRALAGVQRVVPLVLEDLHEVGLEVSPQLRVPGDPAVGVVGQPDELGVGELVPPQGLDGRDVTCAGARLEPVGEPEVAAK